MSDPVDGLEPSRPFPTEPPLRERLVVGVADDGGWLTVVCQDGTVFRRDWRVGHWEEKPPIPGTPRWYQVTGAEMEPPG